MSLPSDSSEDERFYTEAAKKVFDWLDDRDRFRIGQELQDNDIEFDNLPRHEQLFILLRFLEVNYVRIPRRMEKIRSDLDSLNKKIKKEPIADFEIPDIYGEYLGLSSLKERVPSSEEIEAKFNNALRSAGILEPFNEYFARIKEGSRSEFF